VLQLLPVSDNLWDFLDANTWNKFSATGRFPWVRPLQKDLDEVKRFHAVLESRTFALDDPVVYVAGVGHGTPTGINLSDRGELIFMGTDQGDGTVTWQSGILPELEGRTWYMYAPHGDMANHPESFAAIYELLQEGKTMRLSQNRPQVSRGMTESYVLPEEPPQIYPAQEDLEQVVLNVATQPLQESERRSIRVSVVHGDLAFCQNPVAVGHFEGDGLYSAERYLDYHLNGSLSLRLRLGLYPGQQGTVEVLLKDKNERPGGAVIAGLGKPGELSPQKLTQTFAAAMREYGIRAMEQNWIGQEGELAISTVLIGTGGSGLSIRSSIDAILSGIILANENFANLHKMISAPDIRIAEVQFVELFRDKATLAVKALRTYLDSEEYNINPFLITLRGGWNRIAYDEGLENWNRIHVRGDANNTLIFSIPTDRARSEEARLGVQRRSVDRLISQAVTNPRWDRDLATTMFELLIPNRLKETFRDLNNVVLALDSESAQYPWELLYDRRTAIDSPLVVQFGMIRQYSTVSFQERVNDEQNNNVLVIGNPIGLPPNFANLPGAEEEARKVVDRFAAHNDLESQKFHVESAIHTDSADVINKLFSKDYRVLHLAAHGVYSHTFREYEGAEPELITGVVLGDGVFLTANEIKNKVNIPELVFINCCHLGKLEGPHKPDQAPSYALNEFAASLSQELIQMGVKAVVAAGWTVDDRAAAKFADVFYDRMLSGYSFGEAIKEARRETYNKHRDTNTWAAYQCYGNPAYRLKNIAKAYEYFTCIEEAILEINNIAETAKTTSALGIERLRDSLVRLTNEISRSSQEWLNDSRLQEALGKAFGEVYLFDRAIEYYQLALDNQKCAASVRAFEQLANIRTRSAVQLFNSDPNCYYEKSKAIIEAQIHALKALMRTLCETSERWSLIGGANKRMALISRRRSPETADLALQRMENAYREAGGKAQDDPYALANRLAARILRLLQGSDPAEIHKALPKLKTLAKKAIQLAEAQEEKSPDDFWASIGTTDATLINHLVTYLESGWKELRPEELEKLAARYQTTWRRYGSARELYSVIDQYAFLAAMLEGSETHNELSTRLSSILRSLEDAVAR
jgi:hypothetical protein